MAYLSGIKLKDLGLVLSEGSLDNMSNSRWPPERKRKGGEGGGWKEREQVLIVEAVLPLILSFKTHRASLLPHWLR